MADFEIVETKSDLKALAKDLMKEKIVAVDTEADSFYHYFDKTCLVQVGTSKGAWLIDPLALGGPAELAPLGPVFKSPDVRVLFHAAEYDIYVLKRDCNFEFNHLFDTMVSAQLLGYPAVGLGALVERHFGIVLPKDEQRSDWSRRPLTPKQLSYAASDVEFLISLAEKLERELKKAKRLDWALAEFEALTHRRWTDRAFDEIGYIRIKGAKTLEPKALSVLRNLYIVRDNRAREIDRPPFKVLGNRTLIEIAESRPKTLTALGDIKGVTELILRRMGKDLLEAVREGRKTDHGPMPKIEGNSRRRMDRKSEKRLGELKVWRTRRSAELKIDPGVLCPNASLEAIACEPPKVGSDLEGRADVKSWFAKSFGDEIVDVLNPAAPSERQ